MRASRVGTPQRATQAVRLGLAPLLIPSRSAPVCSFGTLASPPLLFAGRQRTSDTIFNRLSLGSQLDARGHSVRQVLLMLSLHNEEGALHLSSNTTSCASQIGKVVVIGALTHARDTSGPESAGFLVLSSDATDIQRPSRAVLSVASRHAFSFNFGSPRFACISLETISKSENL
ncbi:hypothetical protein FB451DRAFT_1533357 [Mycena latifolia]|nr:hypothetical protein FB451DRAFT_1533357 [Mycena latifolia]